MHMGRTGQLALAAILCTLRAEMGVLYEVELSVQDG